MIHDIQILDNDVKELNKMLSDLDNIMRDCSNKKTYMEIMNKSNTKETETVQLERKSIVFSLDLCVDLIKDAKFNMKQSLESYQSLQKIDEEGREKENEVIRTPANALTMPANKWDDSFFLKSK